MFHSFDNGQTSAENIYISLIETVHIDGLLFGISLIISDLIPQAIKDDGLPQNVCIGCLSEIYRAFSFKCRSERSENTLRQYLNRLTVEKETEASTNPVSSDTTEDLKYEIIEEEEEQSITKAELTVKSKNGMENDESSGISSNVLDRRKVFVLTPNDNLSNPINVVYECHLCYDTFESISSCEQHMTKFHSHENQPKDDGTAEQIVCPICNLSVDDADILQQHIRENHSNDHSNEDEEFYYEDGNVGDTVEIDETTTTIHEDDACIVQEIVTNEVPTKDVVVAPIVIVTNESSDTELKFNCLKCGGKFAKEQSLNIHIKLDKCTIKSFECEICKKVFVRKNNLICHMQTHTKPSAFSCKVCSEKFTQADKLAIHIQKHHEPSRKFLCPYCWKGNQSYESCDLSKNLYFVWSWAV